MRDIVLTWPESSSKNHAMQGVFQVAAAQPVNYVIEEIEDLFSIDNMVRASSWILDLPDVQSIG